MELFILSIIEFIILFWAISYATQIKMSIKRILAFILLSMCPSILIFQLIGQWQGIVFLLVSSFTYFFWLSRAFLTLIHICFVLIIGVFTDNLTQVVMKAFPYDALPGMLEHYCIFTVLFILCIIIYKHSTRKIYKLLEEMKTAYILILIIALVTMSTFYINLYLTEYLSEDNLLKFNIITQITYFTIMLFVLYLTIVNIKKENHFRRVEIETAQFTDYMRSLEVINNDMQKFRHDHANILASMQGYIEVNDFEGLKKYFKKHIFSAEEDTLKRNMRLANLSKLQITGIKGLILTKTLQAEKEGITVNIEVPDVIDELNMNIIDIARILGIFLDNAIEANMQNHTDKEIDIAIFKSRSNSIMIIIENTIEDDHSVKIDKIFNDGFSTKGENRGKGLSTVRSIINTYPNVVLRTNVNNGVFSQIIEMAKSEGS
ncbi:two-component system sensor histidine kinase AgrC [Lysinibacillus composti]|uniref:GHKL domain-containing protein n=1 Tax=Lysinibacillus composti TaxID=720633 RepID=A0A3N9U9P0_9BACI|nr:GHKL domain-containing protein [Lysinibacillus composti]MBM7610037.1 two-component system sensor histidine kinase AgrC [Lysinibacillus composti]RQW73298.1 GHKL domain-containing protein [Lysinibacillus composti]